MAAAHWRPRVASDDANVTYRSPHPTLFHSSLKHGRAAREMRLANRAHTDRAWVSPSNACSPPRRAASSARSLLPHTSAPTALSARRTSASTAPHRSSLHSRVHSVTHARTCSSTSPALSRAAGHSTRGARSPPTLSPLGKSFGGTTHCPLTATRDRQCKARRTCTRATARACHSCSCSPPCAAAARPLGPDTWARVRVSVSSANACSSASSSPLAAQRRPSSAHAGQRQHSFRSRNVRR